MKWRKDEARSVFWSIRVRRITTTTRKTTTTVIADWSGLFEPFDRPEVNERHPSKIQIFSRLYPELDEDVTIERRPIRTKEKESEASDWPEGEKEFGDIETTEKRDAKSSGEPETPENVKSAGKRRKSAGNRRKVSKNV